MLTSYKTKSLANQGMSKISSVGNRIKDMNENRNIWKNKDMAKSAQEASKPLGRKNK